jgi:SAM-dependent MidA family methyltransferase
MASWLAEIALAEGGSLRFDRFMDLALNHPQHGYYSQKIANIGREGDFSTTTSLSGLLANALKRWIRTEAQQLKIRPIRLIELGAGTGQLAAALLRQFGPFQRIDYRIVETSTSLTIQQQTLLRGKNISWHSQIAEALQGIEEAIVFSNEFVDTFPCRRFVKQANDWQEVSLTLKNGVWREELRPIFVRPDSTLFEQNASVGHSIEVHEAYHAWLKVLRTFLGYGSLLTIDYGGLPAERDTRLPAGTIRAYYRHQRLTGREIYLRSGRQDLTADVNFEDLQRWGIALGFHTVGYSTQTEFLRTWAKQAPRTPADLFVTDSSGAGSAFKVLHQRVGRRG